MASLQRFLSTATIHGRGPDVQFYVEDAVGSRIPVESRQQQAQQRVEGEAGHVYTLHRRRVSHRRRANKEITS